MDVRIYPPYRSDNCLGQNVDPLQLQQIRKMVNHMFLLFFPITNVVLPLQSIFAFLFSH